VDRNVSRGQQKEKEKEDSGGGGGGGDGDGGSGGSDNDDGHDVYILRIFILVLAFQVLTFNLIYDLIF